MRYECTCPRTSARRSQMETVRRFFILALAVMLLGAGRASAQVADTSLGTFRVIQGTTLWDLAAAVHQSGWRWNEIFDTNVEAGILDSARLSYDTAGRPIVILEVGEVILLNRQAARSAPSVVTEAPAQTPSPLSVSTSSERRMKWLWLLLLIAAILFLLYLTNLIRRSFGNPVGSGPPIREGGLTDEAAPDYFRSAASQRTGAAGTAGYVPPEQVRVVNIRRGRGFGLMRVRYRDGREELKRLRGEVVYQATVEFPDGRQETSYTLQGCANDLRFFGTRYFADRLFRFEPENVSIYTPPQETVARAGGAEVRITEDELTVSQGGRVVTFAAEGWGLRQGPDGGLIISSEGRTDIEFRDGRIRGVEKPEILARRRMRETETERQ